MVYNPFPEINLVCIAYDGTTLEYETLDKILKGIDKAEKKEN